MIGIAVFAILVSLAAPQFSNMMRRQELNSQTGLLKSTLAYARNEAISRRKPVYICGAGSASECTTAEDTDWSAGWLVFVDEGSNPDILLKRHKIKTAKISLTANVGELRYNQDGEAGTPVDLTMCTDDKKNSRILRINRVGSIRAIKGNDCS